MGSRDQRDFREEIGWRELVETSPASTIPFRPTNASGVAILAGIYGEAGAINLYGPDHGYRPRFVP